MPKLTINGQAVEVPPGATVLQACESAGVEVPRFCYHERLSIAGNCRMCLVEQEKAPKPIASCAMPAADGMVIHTDSPMARKARKGVMEFLLINHPLDCPICDQGGECDLQDQAMAYGFDRGRYDENKRAVPDKDFGPLVKTSMNRCIHCTRCIRFITEVAGIEELGATFRGEHMEVTTYVEKALSSELSGNIIDLCPVGALTSKPYAFSARPWELRKVESVDVLDAVGAAIRVDVRGGEVLRVLPRLNEAVNEEWLADKSRFACDGLRRQRLDRPYVRRDGKLQPATWPEALAAVAARLDGVQADRIAALAGDLACVESMVALKDLFAAIGSGNIDCRQDGAALDPRTRASYVFNTTIAGIEQADACLLIGTNPRWEAPVLNARLRKRFLAGGFRVALIGQQTDLTYRYDYLGAGPQTLADLASGKLAFGDLLRLAKRPMLILGQGALARPDGAAILALAREVAEKFNMVREDWNGFNVLHTAAARVGGMDAGFVPGHGGRGTAEILQGAQNGTVEFVYLLGADEIDPDLLGKAFVVYQGHHGDEGAHRADVVLPGAAYTEKNATYVNTEGRPQQARLAVFPPGEAREDWKIIRALSEAMGKRLPYDNLAQLRRRMESVNPIFAAPGQVAPVSWGAFGTSGPVQAAPFATLVSNYYMTDPISRASETMAKCTATFIARTGDAKAGAAE
ncbi:MAG: NADH-quinone oxidoreductase subunit G [Alphaproteobacteria bacterium]|nr:NADH-quinone oxidoreductase subunit G [Alphaproteobacteria bacterium]